MPEFDIFAKLPTFLCVCVQNAEDSGFAIYHHPAVSTNSERLVAVLPIDVAIAPLDRVQASRVQVGRANMQVMLTSMQPEAGGGIHTYIPRTDMEAAGWIHRAEVSSAEVERRFVDKSSYDELLRRYDALSDKYDEVVIELAKLEEKYNALIDEAEAVELAAPSVAAGTPQQPEQTFDKPNKTPPIERQDGDDDDETDYDTDTELLKPEPVQEVKPARYAPDPDRVNQGYVNQTIAIHDDLMASLRLRIDWPGGEFDLKFLQAVIGIIRAQKKIERNFIASTVSIALEHRGLITRRKQGNKVMCKLVAQPA